MKLLFENWRKFLTEERSIEEKLGELFWDDGAHGVFMAQTSGNDELAAKMTETIDKVKKIIKEIDRVIKQTEDQGKPDLDEIESVKMLVIQDDESVDQPYHGEEWWDEDKYEELYDPTLWDATLLPWFVIPGSPPRWRIPSQKEVKSAYDYIKKWAGVK
tara:strand:- start:14 stop:490 length:477 start_codon:yes stop_codon:yes gene_type:complete